jgi:TonB family protein
MNKPGTWEAWEGQWLNGKFPLRLWLGGSDQTAVFVTELPGSKSQKAAIKLIPAEAEDADRRIERWGKAAQVSHPHLLRIFEWGRGRLEGTPLLFVVTEYAEEDLSQILPQRALAEAEVTALLPPLVDALSYLHAKGFVHGHLKPSNILACNNQLKLSTDHLGLAGDHVSKKESLPNVYSAPEIAAGALSPACDVWSLGATLVATLTQQQRLQQEAEHRQALALMPEPFRGIAQECLRWDPKQRCSIADVKARVGSVPTPVTSTPAPAARRYSALPGPSSLQRNASHFPWRLLIVVAALLLIGVLVGRKVLTRQNESVNSRAEGEGAQATQPANPVPQPAGSSRGAVTKKILPEVPRSARNTIQGKIRVGVQVDVDSSGKVGAARLVSPGPSKYFANLALKAAREWEFTPPLVNGQATPSTWLLRFQFGRASTEAIPSQQ